MYANSNMVNRGKVFDIFPVAEPSKKPAPKVSERPKSQLMAQDIVRPKHVRTSVHQVNNQPANLYKPAPLPEPKVLPVPLKRTETAQSKPLKSRVNYKQMAVNTFVALLITAGELVPALQQRPYLVILAYVWAVIVFSIESKITFTLAAILLAAVPILNLGNRQALAENYAILAYLILVVGVVSAAFELRSNANDKMVRQS